MSPQQRLFGSAKQSGLAPAWSSRSTNRTSMLSLLFTWRGYGLKQAERPLECNLYDIHAYLIAVGDIAYSMLMIRILVQHFAEESVPSSCEELFVGLQLLSVPNVNALSVGGRKIVIPDVVRSRQVRLREIFVACSHCIVNLEMDRGLAMHVYGNGHTHRL